MKGLERKLLLGGLMLLLGCLAVLFACQENQLRAAPFYVSIGAENTSEQITPWEDKNGNYYVFLPGYADLSNAQIKLNTSKAVLLAGEKLVDGMCCDGIQLDEVYELVIAKEEHARQVTFVQSANVATMYIDTASGSMNYIHAEKGNEEQGKIRLYTADGELNYGGEIEAINGRGNYTWAEYEKKPYSLELKYEANLLEMGAAQKWILLANAGDPSHMRNKIVFEFADEVGLQYSPDSQWVDLYTNGEYQGLYLLTERNEVHEERVRLNGEAAFLVSLDTEDRLLDKNALFFLTNEKQAVRIHYFQNNRDQSIEKISELLGCVEAAIIDAEGRDPVSEKKWSELIDANSWARKYLIEEIVANSDGCFLSQFFYSDGEKVYAGPVWDYDRSLGNKVDWKWQQSNLFVSTRLEVNDNYNAVWFHSLCQKKEFYELVIQLYQEEFVPVLENVLNNEIENNANQIKWAVKADGMRWFGEAVEVSSQAQYIKSYIRERIAFLNKIWIKRTPFNIVKVDQRHGGHYGYFAIFQGECLTALPTLPDNEYQNFLGWYYADTNEPFDSTRPITEDTEIYAKWEDSQQKRVGQIVKLIPLAIIACMGVGILCADIRRSRKGG